MKALLSTEAHFSGFLIPAMKKTKTNANRVKRMPSSHTVRTHIDWEMTIPVLSTSHVKQTTLDALASTSPERIALYPEGAFVHLQPQDKAFACAPELSPVATWFHKSCPKEHWIRLDRDGDIINELPTFEW